MSKKQNNKFKFLINLYKKSEDLQDVLQKAKNALVNENYTYFEMMLKKATVMSAKSTFLLRQSCNEYIVENSIKNEALCRTTDLCKFIFQKHNNGVVSLELPPLINTRLIEKNNKKDSFINFFNDLFYKKIKSFITENHIKKYDEKITMYVINVVKEGTPKTWIPDIDNREYKNLINVVKQFFISDDSSDFLSLHFDTRIGAENKTIVLLVPDKDKVIDNFMVKNNEKIISFHQPENKKIA